MNSYKKSIPLDRIRPSGVNPREDMGDLAALADAIRATGGQPVNPVVVVPDGDAFRIVDGERRWRAMGELGAAEVDCMVFGSYSEADEAVAMLATDSEKGLTDEERARGFQRMLDLGDLGDERVAQATGVSVEAVRQVRRTRPKAAGDRQLSMERIIEASAFEDEADQERVMRAYDPAAEARLVVKEHAAAARREELRQYLPEGCEVMEQDAPREYSPQARGLVYVCKLRGAKAASTTDWDELGGREGLVAYRDGAGWAVYRHKGEEDETAAEAERAELRRRTDEQAERLDECLRSMCSTFYVDDEQGVVVTAHAGEHVSRLVRDAWSREYASNKVAALLGEDLMWRILGSTPVCGWAAIKTIANLASRAGLYYSLGSDSPDEHRCRRFTDVMNAMVLDGWDGREYEDLHAFALEAVTGGE